MKKEVAFLARMTLLLPYCWRFTCPGMWRRVDW